MSGLETSVTLEDVFHVVQARRVPLAPELAGYLTLEIADGADAGAGNVDPKAVFVSEEGSVALVRPKIAPPVGDCEASIRSILIKLLEASGSKTPALAAAAQRKPGNGLPALVEELEAALIPVNRAAGRRALARLARETRRVLQGIGRNATGASGQYSSVRPTKGEEEMLTAKKTNLHELAKEIAIARADPPTGPHQAPPPKPSAPLPPPRGAAAGPPAPPPPPQRGSAGPGPGPGPGLGPEGKPKLFEGDEVDSLLESFGVSGSGEKQMSRDLKAIAGLDPTPGVPDAKSFAAAMKEASKEPARVREPVKDPAAARGSPPKIQKRKPDAPDGIEALLALADASGPLAPPLLNPQPQAPKPAKRLPDEMQPPTAAADFPSPALPYQPAAVPQTPGPPLVHSAPLPQAAHPPVAPMAPYEPPPLPPMPNFAPIPPPDPEPRRIPAPPPSQPPNKRERKDSQERRRQQTSVTRKKAPRTGLVMSILALLALVGGTAAVWKFAPQVFTGRRRPPVNPSATVTTTPPAPRCKVALNLTDVPANAEILLRMGQAPVDVERMPVGTRLELVGTAEGYAPRRAVVRAEAVWDKAPDGKPRVEVPIQLDPSKAKPGGVDPWPAAEPGSQVGGSGPPGTVHVVSNVRGADVWLLAGLGPEARIEQLRCDGDIDVLLAGPPTLRKRIRVPEKDIEAVQADPQGNKVVNVSAR